VDIENAVGNWEVFRNGSREDRRKKSFATLKARQRMSECYTGKNVNGAV